MKLSAILNELLDPSSSEAYEVEGPKRTSHSFSDGTTETNYKWSYKNVKKQKMEIEINFEHDENKQDAKMMISFGRAVKSSDIDSKYSVMTGAGDLKRILKTVIDAAEYVIAKELPGVGKGGLLKVGFEPADDRRERVYRYFIETNFPDFKEDEDRKGYGFTIRWFINQNYQPPQKETSSED